METNNIIGPKCYNPRCNNICKPKSVFEGRPVEYWTLCSSCCDEVSKDNPKHKLFVPELFLDTDVSRLPLCLAHIAENWKPNKKGLLIHGTTRKGKTRTAWYIANRLSKESYTEYRCLFLTMFELEARLISAWGKESWDTEMRRMTSIPLLFLDDMGKEKMTDRMASVLFALIDERTMYRRPTIITTNLTSATLLERFHDKELGAAFVARLKDPDLFETVSANENL